VNNVLGVVSDKVDAVARWISDAPPGRADRGAGLVFGGGAGIVIAIAMHLTPSPDGFGTHRQLGLGACTMLQLTGWPCPMCGMTTTFTLFAHLRPIDALLNQPFGLILFPVTLALAVLGAMDLILGRGALRGALKLVQRRERTWAGVLLFGMIGGWLYKCVIMHPIVFHLSV
jgi:hypothetical protein